MNKAAFLDILHHVSAITDQEISELEKLALNFPYCQSAHLLLAKAAYDRGSMLSNQRLRRAAACATNRQLLKKLIYTSGTDIVLAPIEPAAEPIPAEAAERQTFSSDVVPLTQKEDQSSSVILSTNQEIETPELVIDTTSLNQKEEVSEIITEVPSGPSEQLANTIRLPEAILPITDAVVPEEELLVVPKEDSEDNSETLTPAETIPVENTPVPVQPELTPEFFEDYDLLFTVDHLNSSLPFADPVTAFINNEQTPETNEEITPEELLPASDFSSTTSDLNTAAELVLADDMLARQDPIETEINLAEANVDAQEVLIEADTAAETIARFDDYLFTPEKEDEVTSTTSPTKTYQEELIYKVFDANELGYWMESSRLGETLLLKNDLATAQPYYFSPELLLEYSQEHELAQYEAPPSSILTRQYDIIDQFLKLNPKLKSMVHVKMKAEPQEDLSSRSTKIKKNLASENLATILVQQGKIKKAIKIYEHLILKIPDKKAYFASQIEKLQLLS